MFVTIDANKDGNLTYGELRALVVGIEFEEVDLDHDDAVKRIMEDFDTSRNQLVDEEEFVDGVCRWLHRARRARRASGDAGPHTVKFLSNFHLVSCAMLNFMNLLLAELMTDWDFIYRKQRGSMISWMWGAKVMKLLGVLRMQNGLPSRQSCCYYWELLLLLHSLILWLMQLITFLMLQVFPLSSFLSLRCLWQPIQVKQCQQ